jgi:hypothetical protein
MPSVCNGCGCKENCSFFIAFPDNQKQNCNTRESFDSLIEKNK